MCHDLLILKITPFSEPPARNRTQGPSSGPYTNKRAHLMRSVVGKTPLITIIIIIMSVRDACVCCLCAIQKKWEEDEMTIGPYIEP